MSYPVANSVVSPPELGLLVATRSIGPNLIGRLTLKQMGVHWLIAFYAAPRAEEAPLESITITVD